MYQLDIYINRIDKPNKTEFFDTLEEAEAHATIFYYDELCIISEV